jgi:hypothetical protein
VILKRRGRTASFGTAVSGKRGTSKIRRTARVRGRVYAAVTSRSTSVNCRSGRSRVIRG